MPLPGGPSDKLGNRYELRWITRRFVDLITGRIDWIRLEPPGEDAIEFRLQTAGGQEAHQVKRGGGPGHWTIAALGQVLAGFGELLGADEGLRCVFVSEHAAPELQELSERARASLDPAEFTGKFLQSKALTRAWDQVKLLWDTDEAETWDRLSRIFVHAVSETHLSDETDTVLRLLFEGAPATGRAVLAELGLESVHKTLRAVDVLSFLEHRGVRRKGIGVTTRTDARFVAPPAGGFRRSAQLEQIAALVAAGRSTVFITGIAGIGKTTTAAQFASDWNGAVCWMDCGLMTSGIEALSSIAAFLSDACADNSVSLAMTTSDPRLDSIAQLSGRALGARACLLVWDGMDAPLLEDLKVVINGIAATIGGVGAQIVTTKDQSVPQTFAGVDTVHLQRLEKSAVRRILAEAYPEAGVVELTAADAFTQGHPYLVQLLAGASIAVDLKTALSVSDAPDKFVAGLLLQLPEPTQRTLKLLAWLGIPFSAQHVAQLGAGPELLYALATSHFIVRAGNDTYRVHEIIGNLLTRSIVDAEASELTEQSALLLHGLEAPSWSDLRAMLRHARAASMSHIAREASLRLLKYAMDGGRHVLAREAASNLLDDEEGAKSWYTHYVLGRCARLAGDRQAALKHFANAEHYGIQPLEIAIAQYERASVLCELGRYEEAAPLYEGLDASNDQKVRSMAKTALAFVVAERDDMPAAMALLDEAIVIARQSQHRREEIGAIQAKGTILKRAEHWEEARIHLKHAHRLRHELHESPAQDAYGWYHLFDAAYSVELALGHLRHASDAAHEMWRFSLLLGSASLEKQAAFAMCRTSDGTADADIDAALGRLHAIGDDASRPAISRIAAWEGLVVCRWAMREYELALEAIIEVLAISTEHNIETRPFAHITPKKEQRDNVVLMSEGPFMLFMPTTADVNFIPELATRVFERRPELMKYARLIIAQRPKSKKRRGRSSTKAKKRKRRI